MMDEADSLIQCPYNQSHILYRSRMQTHLVKCKYAHLNPQTNVEPKIMKVCKFNSNHHVTATEIDHHHATCPDIGVLARFVTTQGIGSAVPYNPIELPPPDENWDAEECTSTYDPEQHASSSVIIRSKQGVPKSVRKNFRMQERERINRLRENQEALEKSGRATVLPKPDVVNTAFGESSLRPPRSALLGMGRGRIMRDNEALGAPDFVTALQDVLPMQPRGPSSAPYASALSDGSSSPPSGVCSPDIVSGLKGSECSGSTANNCASDLETEDGFFQRKSKKNRKKEQTAAMNLPMGRGAAGNPLMSNSDSVANSLPSLPGRGRGRLPME